MHARVISETPRCTQVSFGALMRTTRKAILTDARNGLLDNGYAQGKGQSWMRATYIPAGNPSNRLIVRFLEI